MGIPTVRLVFDRKHVATVKRKGLVQMEVCYERKRRWIGMGIRLYSDQWDDRRLVVNSTEMTEYNELLRTRLSEMEKWLRDNFSDGGFEWSALDARLHGHGKCDSFVDFVRDTIASRNDIRKSTKKAHYRLVGLLLEYGRINTPLDLKPSTIGDFDNWMHGRKVRKLDKDGNELMAPMGQQTIYGYHKLMKTYIHIGMREGYVKSDPYQFLRLRRGESDPGRYLDDVELAALENAEMRSGSVARARDMFIFQCYTGLAYADMRLFDFSKADKDGAEYVYSGKRKKTGESFFFVILPKAMAILRKYGFSLPVTAQQSYNDNLKKAAADAGIGKPISSHWGRRTAAVNFVNHGVRLEVVAKILGHASVSTTEQFYAQIVRKTVVEEMRKAVPEEPSNV